MASSESTPSSEWRVLEVGEGPVSSPRGPAGEGQAELGCHILTGVEPASQKGSLTTSRDILGCHSEGRCYWHLMGGGREAAHHSPERRPPKCAGRGAE